MEHAYAIMDMTCTTASATKSAIKNALMVNV
jgi:hypothetical protein